MLSEAKPLLKVENLSANIGGQTVLHDISLNMSQGDWLGVVGGSGAGKSTLLRTILGVRRPAKPQKGFISFNGIHQELSQKWSGHQKGIAYVPQSPAHGLDPLRRISWQWSQLARCKKCLAEYEPLFTSLGLPNPQSQFPHQWSLGMQQRLLLAMALMEEPKLLILDEPTSALDAMIAAQVLNQVQSIAHDKRIGVLMVTHDLALAARFANIITIMDKGRIVESGAADIVLNKPVHPYAKELVAHKSWQRARPVNA